MHVEAANIDGEPTQVTVSLASWADEPDDCPSRATGEGGIQQVAR